MGSQHCSVCSVETGTKIFAIINSVIVGLASIVSFFWILGLSMSERVERDRLLETITIGIGVLVASLTFIAFAFSVVLAQGVFKRKRAYVKAYCIYGMVVVSVCVCFASSMTLIFWSAKVKPEIFSVVITIALSVIGICTVYSAILWMIWATYKKFLLEDQYVHHILEKSVLN